MFALLNFIIYMVLYAIMLASMGPAMMEASQQAEMGMQPTAPSAGFFAGAGIVGILLLIYGLAVLIPSLAVGVRRMHDQDKSGWFILLGLIPFVGPLILLVFFCLEGTNGPNQYGPDPKAGEPGHSPT